MCQVECCVNSFQVLVYIHVRVFFLFLFAKLWILCLCVLYNQKMTKKCRQSYFKKEIRNFFLIYKSIGQCENLQLRIRTSSLKIVQCVFVGALERRSDEWILWKGIKQMAVVIQNRMLLQMFSYFFHFIFIISGEANRVVRKLFFFLNYYSHLPVYPG